MIVQSIIRVVFVCDIVVLVILLNKYKMRKKLGLDFYYSCEISNRGISIIVKCKNLQF